MQNQDKAQPRVVTVVGGSGFLGSHFADQLSEAGHHVRIYDKIDSPWKRPNQEMVVGDLLDVDLLKKPFMAPMQFITLQLWPISIWPASNRSKLSKSTFSEMRRYLKHVA